MWRAKTFQTRPLDRGQGLSRRYCFRSVLRLGIGRWHASGKKNGTRVRPFGNLQLCWVQPSADLFFSADVLDHVDDEHWGPWADVESQSGASGPGLFGAALGSIAPSGREKKIRSSAVSSPGTASSRSCESCRWRRIATCIFACVWTRGYKRMYKHVHRRVY